jgi:hypothetical protein
MQKHIFILLLSITFTAISSAQSLVYPEEHELTQLLNPWSMFQNAAGLGVSPIKTHGVTELGYNKNNGDYHRAQEGSDLSGLNFYSERYDKLGKNWLVWGSFDFQMNREMNRFFSDVFFPYNSSPYIFGSSVKGNYDKQLFDLHAKLSTIQKGKFTYGVGIDYTVADLSRLRDPRSRTYLADYAAVPAITFQLSSAITLGADGFIRYQKEKMPSIVTVQDDPGLKYYSFFGMENADAVIGSYKGFQRDFESNFYGGDFQIAFTKIKIKWITSIGAEYQQQNVFGSIQQSPGSYKSLNYKAMSVLNLTQNNILVHGILKANYYQGAADELRQDLITVRDTATGIASQEWITLFTYKNRYRTDSYNVELDLNLRNLLASGKDYTWEAGLNLKSYGFDNRYNMPYSEMAIDRMKTGIYGQYRLFDHKNHRVKVSAGIDYDFCINSKLNLSDGATLTTTSASSTFEQGTYDIANQIILPDFGFYQDKAFSYNAEANYSFPLNLKKTTIAGFAKLFFKNTISDHHGSWMNVGVSIGIIPL